MRSIMLKIYRKERHKRSMKGHFHLKREKGQNQM